MLVFSGFLSGAVLKGHGRGTHALRGSRANETAKTIAALAAEGSLILVRPLVFSSRAQRATRCGTRARCCLADS